MHQMISSFTSRNTLRVSPSDSHKQDEEEGLDRRYLYHHEMRNAASLSLGTRTETHALWRDMILGIMEARAFSAPVSEV